MVSEQRTAPTARSLPLQQPRRPLASRSPPLQPARRSLAACLPLACGPLAAPTARELPSRSLLATPCSHLAVSVELFRGEVLAVARESSSSVGVRPLRPSSFMSGLLCEASRGSVPPMPPDPGIEVAALGASESALPGSAPAAALHTFTLDSGASRCFFRGSTTLTPLSALVPVRLADPSGGSVLARSSTILPCLAVASGSLSGLHLPSFSTNLVSTAALLDAMVTTTTPGGIRVRSGSTPLLVSPPDAPDPPEAPPPWSPLPATPSWHALPPPCFWSSQVSASPPALACPALPSLPRVSGQDSERYFLLVVDDYTRYTTVFPLRSKGEVLDVLIPWIRAVRFQLREWFHEDLPVLRLHSDRGGEFSSNLLRDFCCGEGILQSFTLPASPQQNGIAERRIDLVREGSRAFVRDTSADKLSSRAISCVFLGFPPDTLGLQFYHPTSRRVLPSQNVTFDESVPFYRLFPYRTAPLPPLPLFLAPGPPPVDPLPPQGPPPSGVFQADPLPRTVPVEVVVDSGAARGAASGVAASGGVVSRCAEPSSAEPGSAKPDSAESGGAKPEGAEPGGAEFEGAASRGAELGGAEPGGTEPKGTEPGGAESEGAESGGAEPRGTASAGGPAGASPRLSPRREPLSPQQLHEWFAQHIRLRSGAAGAGGSATGGSGAGGAGATSLGGAGVTGGDGGTGGAGAAGPGGAHTRCLGAGGAGAGDLGAGGAGAGGTCAGGAGAGGAGAGDSGAGGAGAGGVGVGDP
ncbi:unnamed protein product [Closterium sp. NIES-53]